MVTQRISLITLGAFDLPKLRAFYKSLGWTEAEFSSDFADPENNRSSMESRFSV